MTTPLIVVSAGTYHLAFDRLSEWVEQWLSGHNDVRVVMQHGPSRPVLGAENVEILPYSDLLELCRQADVVVLQGGAGAVMDMRALGIVPIVVPRVPGGGEVVDDHQLVFSAEMAALGVVRRALTAADLEEMIDESLRGGGVEPGDIATPGAEAVRQLLEQPIIRAPRYAFIPRLLRVFTVIVAAKLRR